jgi:hypothetical protein
MLVGSCNNTDINRSSFRFEVKVTTPHFEIARPSTEEHSESFLEDPKKRIPRFPFFHFRKASQYLISDRIPVPLLGTTESRIGTFCQFGMLKLSENLKFIALPYGKSLEDAPTWVDLLVDLHRLQLGEIADSLRLQNSVSRAGSRSDLNVISITRRTRS